MEISIVNCLYFLVVNSHAQEKCPQLSVHMSLTVCPGIAVAMDSV